MDKLIKELIQEKKIRKAEKEERFNDEMNTLRQEVNFHEYKTLLEIVLDAKAWTFKNKNCVFARETLKKYEEQLMKHPLVIFNINNKRNNNNEERRKKISRLIQWKGEIAELELSILENAERLNNSEIQASQEYQQMLRKLPVLRGC